LFGSDMRGLGARWGKDAPVGTYGKPVA